MKKRVIVDNGRDEKGRYHHKPFRIPGTYHEELI